jgi:hypothetical protein
MKESNQQGSVLVTVLLSVFIVLFLAAAGLGLWALGSRNDYKNNVDQKVAAAVETAKQQEAAAKDKEFEIKYKNPYRTYTGPAAYGSIKIVYPRDWSAYVDESGKGNYPVDGYFHPATVPGLQSGASYALRAQVTNTQYSIEVHRFDSYVKTGKVKVTPFSAAKVTGPIGVRVDGEVQPKEQGSMIILPLRDKTLKIWTEANQYQGDFNTIVLPNLTFEP